MYYSRPDTQWAHHGQTTWKQRCIDVTDVDTTLFRRRLTMTYPLGNIMKRDKKYTMNVHYGKKCFYACITCSLRVSVIPFPPNEPKKLLKCNASV